MGVSNADFEYVTRMMREQAGVQLSPDQLYLVDTRLTSLVYREGLPSIEFLLEKLRAEPISGEIHRKVIESLVTTETYFFRDNGPFDALKNQVIPRLIAGRAMTKTITIWCGASSTGQEPYSIAMLIKESFSYLQGWNFRIIATDISEENLDKAHRGRYSNLQIGRGLPAEIKTKYFSEVEGEWQLRDDIRQMVEFRRLNLLEPWTIVSADVVFLRNVMIYFEVETKKEILQKIRSFLPKDGALFLGSCETTIALDPDYEPIYSDNTVYFRMKT